MSDINIFSGLFASVIAVVLLIFWIWILFKFISLLTIGYNFTGLNWWIIHIVGTIFLSALLGAFYGLARIGK